jgi:hypothetical protein
MGAALVACVATALIAPPAAAAGPYPPTAPCALSIDSATLSTGQSLTVTGSGLGPDLDVKLVMQPSNVTLGGAHTDDAGGFVAVVPVPTTLSPGTYLLVASSSSVSCQLTTKTSGAGPTQPIPQPGESTSGGNRTSPGTESSGSRATTTRHSPAATSSHSTSERSTPSSSPSPTTPVAISPDRSSGHATGPILLTLALIALLVLGGSWLMLALTGRPRT